MDGKKRAIKTGYRKIIFLITVALLAGCVSFHPQYLSPSSTASTFAGRTLGLLTYMEKSFIPLNEARI